jgi:hypothetical protein
MHYKNGRQAKNGDMIIFLGGGTQRPVCGVLWGARAEGGSDCNGMIATLHGDHYADLKNCLAVEDIEACANTLEDISKLPPPPSA